MRPALMEIVGAFPASVRGFDADLARPEAKIDALPTKEWIRSMIGREMARTAALAATVAAAGTLALFLA